MVLAAAADASVYAPWVEEKWLNAVLAEAPAKRIEIITSLIGSGDESIAPLLNAWKEDALFLYTAPDGSKFPVQLSGDKDDKGAQAATRIDTGKPVLTPAGQPLRLVASELTATNVGLFGADLTAFNAACVTLAAACKPADYEAYTGWAIGVNFAPSAAKTDGDENLIIFEDSKKYIYIGWGKGLADINVLKGGVATVTPTAVAPLLT